MDSHISDANNQIIMISGVSSKSNEEDLGSPSIDQGGSSESAAAADGGDPPLPPPPGFANYQLAVADGDREYGCRYCQKKFSNKQALGGHQNAHKVERAMEKNVHEPGGGDDGGDGYYGGDGSAPYPYPYPPRINLPGPILTNYVRPSPHPDFLHRSLFGWNGVSGGVVPYGTCTGAAAFNNNMYPRWSAPPAPYPPRPHFTLPSHNVNMGLPNLAGGGPNHQGFAMRPAGSNRPPVRPVNLRNMNIPGEQQDESGLDLSLKLG